MTCTCDCIYSFNVILVMGAESTRNMYSNLAVNNKYDCLKLHHVGYLIIYMYVYIYISLFLVNLDRYFKSKSKLLYTENFVH